MPQTEICILYGPNIDGIVCVRQIDLGSARPLNKYQNLKKMASDFNVTVTSWFLELEHCALTQIASKNVVKSEQIVKVFLIYMTLSQELKLFKVCFCGVLGVYPLLELFLHIVDFLKNQFKLKNCNQFLLHIRAIP